MNKADQDALRAAMDFAGVHGFTRVEVVAPSGYRAGIVRDEAGLLIVAVAPADGPWAHGIRPMDGTVHRLSKKSNAFVVTWRAEEGEPEEPEPEEPLDPAALRQLAKAAYLKALQDIRGIEAANGQNSTPGESTNGKVSNG